MGTTREPRDTPIEFVEVPLLSALSVAWGNSYRYALAAIASAMREDRMPHNLLKGVDISGRTGIDVSITMSCCGAVRWLRMRRTRKGLRISYDVANNWPLVPEMVVRCRVNLNRAELDADDLAQLGLTRVA